MAHQVHNYAFTRRYQTAWNVFDHALDPAVNNVRLEPKEKGPSALLGSQESTVGVALIVAMTTLPAPTISQDWNHLLPNPDNRAYAKLRSSLTELGKRIDERNKNRFTCMEFHPENVRLSISS